MRSKILQYEVYQVTQDDANLTICLMDLQNTWHPRGDVGWNGLCLTVLWKLSIFQVCPSISENFSPLDGAWKSRDDEMVCPTISWETAE